MTHLSYVFKRAIRSRLIECFERASSPELTSTEREKLLHFLVIGGGPTSVEFAAELYDFLVEDVKRWYADLFHLVRVSLVEASPHILNTFDHKLSGASSFVLRVFFARRSSCCFSLPNPCILLGRIHDKTVSNATCGCSHRKGGQRSQ